MPKPHRACFVLPVAALTNGNQLAASIGIDPEWLLNTLQPTLVPADGPDDAEATYCWCSGSLTEPQRQALEQAAGQFPGAVWHRWDNVGQPICRASHDDQNIGEPWSWQQTLQQAGLKPRRVAIS